MRYGELALFVQKTLRPQNPNSVHKSAQPCTSLHTQPGPLAPFHAMMAAAAQLLEMKSLTLLGSTGSIGANTLDVVRHNPGLYRVQALAAGHNVEAILQQIIEFQPNVAVLATSAGIDRLSAALSDSGLPRPNWPELAFGEIGRA